jgi:Rrf2 family protein
VELTRSAQFAIRTVVDVAAAGHVHTAEVARRRGIPPAQAAKIVRQLARAGIVRTTRGAGGGVRLARPAERVTLREVIDAIEGPLAVSRCVVYGECPCVQPCPVRVALARVQLELERSLASITVADLTADGRGPARRLRSPAA